MESQIKKGFIYVVVNPAFPDLVKIGYTTKTVEERIYQMSNSSSVPEKFIIAYKIHVVNPHKVEKIIHADLENYRVNASREFFKITVTLAIDSVLKNSAPYEIPTSQYENIFSEKPHEQIKECDPHKKQDRLHFYAGIRIPRWVLFSVTQKDHPHPVNERQDSNPYNLGFCKKCGMWRGDMLGSEPNLIYSKIVQMSFSIFEDNRLKRQNKDCDRYCVLGNEIKLDTVQCSHGAFLSLGQHFSILKELAKSLDLEPYLNSINIYALDKNKTDYVNNQKPNYRNSGN